MVNAGLLYKNRKGKINLELFKIHIYVTHGFCRYKLLHFRNITVNKLFFKRSREFLAIAIPQEDGSYLIKLTQDQYARIDAQSIDKVEQYLWHALFSPHRKVFTAINGQVGKMHRYLTNPPADMTVHHINCNTLDNRLSNLLVCSMGENNRYKTKRTKKKWYFSPWPVDLDIEDL
ncbi:hypothetical protein LCGC14_1470650 [marine sediment metagenome]|uniref:HNH nuclease domain-containing protein n=1 Tax=marine sediment metagenome TaxID=412755 RepID=A0A0F9ME83_9ZZZZ